MFIVLNSLNRSQKFLLPSFEKGNEWELVLDTREPKVNMTKERPVFGGEYELVSRSLAVFILKKQNNNAENNETPAINE